MALRDVELVVLGTNTSDGAGPARSANRIHAIRRWLLGFSGLWLGQHEVQLGYCLQCLLHDALEGRLLKSALQGLVFILAQVLIAVLP